MMHRFCTLLFLFSVSFVAHTQVYLHPLMDSEGQGTYFYYLNQEGEVVSSFDEYVSTRIVHESKRSGFTFITEDTAGNVIEKGSSDQADPIYFPRNGSYEAYFADGDSSVFIAYKRGVPHGIARGFYPSGKLKYKGENEKGYKTGQWTWYYESGSIERVELYHDGRANGIWKRYHANGALSWSLAFVKGLPIGIESHYNDDGGLLEQYAYEGRQRNGVYVRYARNGEIIQKGNYIKGKRSGDWQSKYDQERLHFQGSFEDGKRVGDWVKLNEQGDTTLFGSYTTSGFTGFERGYSQQGSKAYEANYLDGKLSGTTLFDASGACFANTRGEETILRQCHDGSKTTLPALYSEPSMKVDPSEDLERMLVGEKSEKGEHYGVYHFSVGRNGRVTDLDVVDPVDPNFDATVLGALSTMQWENGTHYGYPARFSNECSILISEGSIQVLIGRAYFNDPLLPRQSHVPLRDGYKNLIETAPAFPGGEEALQRWMATNLRYSNFAQEHQKSGQSIVKFTVEPSGVLSNIQIERNAEPSLDYEAIAATRRMPLWISGEKEGSEVRTVYKLPYRFTLR